MFRYISKQLFSYRTIDSKCCNIRYLKSISSLEEERAFTISYLTNACGLPLKSALSASEEVKIKNTKKADSVIKLLIDHGFTKTHIASLVGKSPRLLLYDAEKVLKPKIEFYRSLGMSGSDLPNMIGSNQGMLTGSLKHRIVPNIEFLKDYAGSNEKVIYALKQRSAGILNYNISKFMVPNINTLLAHGVPKANASRLIVLQPKSLMLKSHLFEKVVSTIRQMEFDPGTFLFILAVRCMSTISNAKWNKKKELFLSYGWSEGAFFNAFRLQPMIMLCSVEKLSTVMEFFLHEIGVNALSVANCPWFFLLSLKRRIIPRWLVLQVLMSKGLIAKNVNVLTLLNSKKLQFEKKFVTPHMDSPEVIEAYQDAMKLQNVKCL